MANEMRDRLRGLLLECGVNINTTSIATHLIENGVIVPQWISVEDRLPDNEERVLVAVDSDKSYTKIDTDRMVYRQWVRWGMSVTHWMPLPEPPKAEQKLKEMRGE